MNDDDDMEVCDYCDYVVPFNTISFYRNGWYCRDCIEFMTENETDTEV
jgi:hypothetical protein